MHRIKILFFAIFLACFTIVEAGERANVAVPEFQNKSGKMVRVSRWDLAVWMAKELERTDRYKTIDRKKVGQVIKDAEWTDEGLSKAVEARLQELSARYVLYGFISEWRIQSAVSSHRFADSRHPDQGIAGATVVFTIRFVDMTGAEPPKEFLVDGNVLGDPNRSQYGDPPYQDDDFRFEDLFEEACKQALRNAAKQITKNQE